MSSAVSLIVETGAQSRAAIWLVASSHRARFCHFGSTGGSAGWLRCRWLCDVKVSRNFEDGISTLIPNCDAEIWGGRKASLWSTSDIIIL